MRLTLTGAANRYSRLTGSYTARIAFPFRLHWHDSSSAHEDGQPAQAARVAAVLRHGGCRHHHPATAIVIAWASILSMPYAILSAALPAKRMGVYMGVFNCFIVIPEIVASLGFGPLIRLLFGKDNTNVPLYVVMFGGVCLLAAAACVGLVHEVAANS